jgi:hypothetical protein
MAGVTQADNNVPQLSFGFDVDSLIENTLTDNCLYSDGLSTFCMFFEDDNSSLQVKNTDEKSPFHESDSGVSEGGSLSPSREDRAMLDEFIDNMNHDPFLLGNEMDQDEELMGYLATERSGENSSQALAKPATVAPVVSERQTRSKTGVLKASTRYNGVQSTVPKVSLLGSRKAAATQAEDDDSDVDIVESENSKQLKGSLRVGRPGSALPSARAKSSDSDASSSCNVTSVKIVRIKNATGNGSLDAADEISRALEERNRKNAELAKVNRQKKKAYIESLEQEVEEGKAKEASLEKKVKAVEAERDDLQAQVAYLQAVLANQSALAGLLKNIPTTSGVKLSSSASRKRTLEMDHSYTPKKPRSAASTTTSQTPAGVCLHVDEGNVSLEFCHHCALMACQDDEGV